MILLIKSLIFLLSVLLFYHFYNILLKIFYTNRREGLTNINDNENVNVNDTKKISTYKDPGLESNPTYLAITNAANIAFLKGQIDDLTGLKQTVNELNAKVENNTQAINGLGQSLKTTSQQLTGRDVDSKEPLPQATGLNYGNMNGIQNNI